MDINVEDDILSIGQLLLDLRLQGAVEAVGIDLFVFHELIGGDAATELLRREEEILHTIAFLSAWSTRGGGDGEGEAQFFARHQMPDDGALAAATGGTKDDGRATTCPLLLKGEG